MSVTTPSTGQKISDFSVGSVDANSFLIQARNGSTEKVSASQIGQFSNLNLLFSELDTTAKSIVGAINEVNAKGVGDIKDVNLSSPADGDALIYDSTSSKWVNKELEADAVAYDNTSSGLTATDVQTAIDEVNAKGIYLATFDFTKSINATTETTYLITRSNFDLPTGAKVKSCFLRENTYNSVNAGGLVYSARVNETATNAIEGAIYNGTATSRVYKITATVFYTLA